MLVNVFVGCLVLEEHCVVFSLRKDELLFDYVLVKVLGARKRSVVGVDGSVDKVEGG